MLPVRQLIVYRTRIEPVSCHCSPNSSAHFYNTNCISLLRLSKQMPQTGGLANSHFLTVLQAKSTRSKCPRVWFLPRLLSLACRCLPSSWILTCLPLTGISGVSVCTDLIVLLRTSVRVYQGPPSHPHFNLITS